MPSFKSLPPKKFDGGRRLPLAAEVAAAGRCPRSRRRRALASARGGPGAGDVRPHRRRLRRDEHRDDGRPAPPLARARGATSPRVGPGSRVLDVATGTGDLAIELARARRARTARSSAATSPRRCSRAPAPRRPDSCASSGPTRSRCPTRTTASTPRRSASARATSPTCAAASRRWRGSCGPAGSVVVLEITTPTRRRCRCSTRLVRPRRARCSGALAGDARRLQLPAAARSALPGARASWPREMDGRGLRGDPLRPDRRRHHRDPRRHGRRGRRVRCERGWACAGAAVRTAGRGRRRRRSCELRRARLRERDGRRRGHLREVTARSSGALAARRSRPAASACARCWSCSSPRLGSEPPRRARLSCAPPWRSSWCTPRRSSTTTSSTARSCGAATRRSSPAAGRDAAIATGDLLFSRAFAELARNGDRRPAARALGRAARRSPAASCCSARTPTRADVTVERYLRALRAEDRRACSRRPAGWARSSRPAGRGAGSPTGSARSRGASGWPSSCSTTCSTSPARSSARARRAAPTCSTARSRCR